MDGVNRDSAIEKDFRKISRGRYGASPYIVHLYTAWSRLRKYDVNEMPVGQFQLCNAILYFSGMHFSVMKEHKIFHDYVKWFADNRIVNTGAGGRAKCEMSEIYVHKKNRIHAL